MDLPKESEIELSKSQILNEQSTRSNLEEEYLKMLRRIDIPDPSLSV